MEARELLGINDVEMKIIEILRKGPNTSKKISTRLRRDISTTNRYLNSLISKGFVTKVSKCCTPKKGRYFVYYLRPKEEVKAEMQKRVAELEKKINGFIDSLYR